MSAPTMTIDGGIANSKAVDLLADLFVAEYASQPVSRGPGLIVTMLNALGACAGFASQCAVWRELILPEKRNPGDFLAHFSLKDRPQEFTVFGEAINIFLFYPMPDRLSFLGLPAGLVPSPSDQINVAELAAHVVSTLGTPNFGVPRVPQSAVLLELPRAALSRTWERVSMVLNEHRPAEWPALLGAAARNLMDVNRHEIQPPVALRILLEAAMPMSKLNPNLVSGSGIPPISWDNWSMRAIQKENIQTILDEVRAVMPPVPPQIAGRPPEIERPRIAFLNLAGPACEAMVTEDVAAFSVWFRDKSVANTSPPPACDVLFLYCAFEPSGAIVGQQTSIQDIIRQSGARIVVVASEVPGASDVLQKAASQGAGHGVNLVVTGKRNGEHFGRFFQSLFKLMWAGTPMPFAWIILAPQGPNPPKDLPGTLSIMGAGQIVFGRSRRWSTLPAVNAPIIADPANRVGERRSAGVGPRLRMLHRLEFGEPINAVAWSPSGSRLAVMSQFGSEITVFSPRDWKAEAKFTRESNAYSGNSFGFVSESEVATESPFSTAEKPASVLVWSVAHGNELASIPCPQAIASLAGVEIGRAYIFTISGDGRRVAAQNGASSREVIIYEIGSGLALRKIISELPLVKVGHPTSLGFSPDGRQLAIGYGGGYLEIYDTGSGCLVRRQKIYPGDLTAGALTFSPDGTHLATGIAKAININRNNPISADIWRTDTGEHVRSLEGLTLPLGPYRETMPVRSLSWSAQGDRLAIGDGTSVRVWDGVSNDPRVILSEPLKNGAYSVSFSPRGVLAVGGGSSVLVFDEEASSAQQIPLPPPKAANQVAEWPPAAQTIRVAETKQAQSVEDGQTVLLRMEVDGDGPVDLLVSHELLPRLYRLMWAIGQKAEQIRKGLGGRNIVETYKVVEQPTVSAHALDEISVTMLSNQTGPLVYSLDRGQARLLAATLSVAAGQETFPNPPSRPS